MRVYRISAGRDNTLDLSEGFGYFSVVCQRFRQPSEASAMFGRDKGATRAAADEAHDRRAKDEAAIENAWRETGNLRVIADRVGLGLLHNEISPSLAWVHKALLDLADASVDIRPYAKEAHRLVRYVAVREAHDREGLSWEDAKKRASEKLRDAPAAAGPEMMWKDYKHVRAALRAAGIGEDDPGYRWVDLPDKSPG